MQCYSCHVQRELDMDQHTFNQELALKDACKEEMVAVDCPGSKCVSASFRWSYTGPIGERERIDPTRLFLHLPRQDFLLYVAIYWSLFKVCSITC